MTYQLTKLHVDNSPPDGDSITETEISQPCGIFNAVVENSAGSSTINQQQYCIGDYVLVTFQVRKTEYRYAAVINQVDNDESELTVTFMKICDKKGHKFVMNENDTSDVSFDQILQKLPNPDVSQNGRLFYYFSVSVPVFEK